MSTEDGVLYVVATPIGNLADITFRAVEVLKKVDLIAAEDTRRAKILLEHYQIETPLVSYFQHSKPSKVNWIISQLLDGKKVALITDAGTPGIADPGGLLVLEAVKNNIKIIPIPGPVGLATALSICGFPTDSFYFVGFLPKKKGREKLLKSLVEKKTVLVFYESPFRIKKTLLDLERFFSDKEVVVAREITKKFETIYRGKIGEVFPQIREQGEFILCLRND